MPVCLPPRRSSGSWGPGWTPPRNQKRPTRSKDLASIERALGVAAEPIDDSEARLASRRQADAGACAAPFDRTIDISWQRTSYSRLTAAAHDAHLADPPGGRSDRSPHPTGGDR